MYAYAKALAAFKEQNPLLAPYVITLNVTNHAGYSTAHVVLKDTAPSADRPQTMRLPNGKVVYTVYEVVATYHPAEAKPAMSHEYAA